MKKIVLLFSLISLFVVNTQVNASFQDESTYECRWQQIDCPGWFTGDYEACLVSGDGYYCTCGAVTRGCKGDEKKFKKT